MRSAPGCARCNAAEVEHPTPTTCRRYLEPGSLAAILWHWLTRRAA